MLERSHRSADTVIAALDERAEIGLTTSLRLEGPYGLPLTAPINDEDIDSLAALTGSEPIRSDENFTVGLLFEVPVDADRAALATAIEQTLASGGKVHTRANQSW